MTTPSLGSIHFPALQIALNPDERYASPQPAQGELFEQTG